MSTLNVNGRNHTVDADPGWRDSRHWKISTPDVLNRATGVLSSLDDPAPLSSTPLIAPATNVRFYEDCFVKVL